MPGLSRDAVLIRQLQGMLDGKRFEVGTFNLTYSGASVSDSEVVSHGLGVVPFAVFVGHYDSAVSATMSAFQVLSATSTTFTVRGKTVDGTAIGPGDLTMRYIAVAVV